MIHLAAGVSPLEQADMALAHGASGVYLIAHGGGSEALLTAFDGVDRGVPHAFIGVNLLGLTAAEALRSIVDAVGSGLIRRAPDGLWVDDIRSDADPSEAMRYKSTEPILADLRLLGGIAFKYTRTATEDPGTAAAEALALQSAVDVVTTSGPGTGQPPSVAKLRAMKTAIDKPLAVASGLDPAGLLELGPWTDEALVASSIETHPYSGVFDRARLADFMAAAAAVGPAPA